MKRNFIAALILSTATFFTANAQGSTNFLPSSGNVGVGMDGGVGPQALLQIGQTWNNGRLPVTIGGTGNKYIGFNVYNESGAFKSFKSNNASAIMRFRTSQNRNLIEQLTFNVTPRGSSSNVSSPINDHPNRDELVIQDGAVGINTSYIPSGYALAINGRVLSTEVKVLLRSAWGDFVFDDTYELEPLEEVEEYIEENNHLPGIPSAKEVQEEGVELGEMVRLQMIKIEELTLHIIELNKKVEELESAE